MSGIITVPGSSSGGGGSGNSFVTDIVTPALSAFWNPLVYVSVSNTQWKYVEYDTEISSAVSTPIFSQEPIALMLNEDLTELWAIEGTNPGTQQFQRIAISSNTSLEVTNITGIVANELIYVAAMHPITGQIYLATRRMPQADGMIKLYSLDVSTPGSAIATIIAESNSTFLSINQSGLAIFPDGTAILSSNPFGLRKLYKLDLDTAEGEEIYSANPSTPWDWEDISATPRLTLLGSNAVDLGAGLAEASYPNFGLQKISNTGGTSHLNSIMAPPINRKLYVGVPIFRTQELDSSGLVIGVTYHLEDQTSITFPDGFPLTTLDEVSKYISKAATGIVRTLPGTSVLTTYSKILDQIGYSGRLTLINIDNTTDRDVYISFDSIVDHFFVKQGGTVQINLESLGLYLPGDVWVKALVSTATSGGVFVSGIVGAPKTP